MACFRAPTAVDPRLFGRRAPVTRACADVASRSAGDDVRLFAMTFAAGFLFVSVLIA